MADPEIWRARRRTIDELAAALEFIDVAEPHCLAAVMVKTHAARLIQRALILSEALPAEEVIAETEELERDRAVRRVWRDHLENQKNRPAN
jgi:hypothetical protein